MPGKNSLNAPPYFLWVWAVAKKIPKGKVTTYGAISDFLAIGSARMVGWAMHHSGKTPRLPAHRVVNRKGELSGRLHFDTPDTMQLKLEAEGIEIKNHIIQNFQQHFWNPVDALGEDFLEQLHNNHPLPPKKPKGV